jgi:hypothetical protein
MITYADKVLLTRNAAGWTQQEFADKLAALATATNQKWKSPTQSQVSRWERREESLWRWLHKPVDDLYCERVLQPVLNRFKYGCNINERNHCYSSSRDALARKALCTAAVNCGPDELTRGVFQITILPAPLPVGVKASWFFLASVKAPEEATHHLILVPATSTHDLDMTHSDVVLTPEQKRAALDEIVAHIFQPETPRKLEVRTD